MVSVKPQQKVKYVDVFFLRRDIYLSEYSKCVTCYLSAALKKHHLKTHLSEGRWKEVGQSVIRVSESWYCTHQSYVSAKSL